MIPSAAERAHESESPSAHERRHAEVCVGAWTRGRVVSVDLIRRRANGPRLIEKAQ